MKRFISAFSYLTFSLLVICLTSWTDAYSKAPKVCYSLPASDNFNSSLNIFETENPTSSANKTGVKKVVLDAGHGGKDPGCSGKHSHEKDVALDITMRVGQLIKRHHPDVEVIYTRKRDEFVELHERAAIANRNKADVFISIHCNTAAKKNSAIGTETFVMGLHRAEDNLQVAKRENAAIELEHDYEDNYDGYDPNSDEGHITLSMYQNAFLDQSISLANLIEDEFTSHGQRVSRGVKQAGFLVLRNTVMPSVLVEAGFLNHSKEEEILTSEEGKDRAAASIFNAFTKYKYDMDKLVAHESSSLPTNEAIPAEHTTNSEIKVQEATASIEEDTPINYIERAKKELERMKQSGHSTNSESNESPIAVNAVQKPSKSNNPRPVQASIPAVTKQEPVINDHDSKATGVKPREKKLEYVVQLSAAATKLRSGGGKWNQVENVLIRYENNLYKYQVGVLDNYEMAAATKAKLVNLGFKDCFIVAYYNDKPISVKQALSMTL